MMVQLAGPTPCERKVVGCPIPLEHEAPLAEALSTRVGAGSNSSGKLTGGKVRSMMIV
jgi:hypothetical protein